MERLKSSKYNFFFDADDGTHLAFNGISGALATFEEETWFKVKQIMEDPNSYDWNFQESNKLRESLLDGFFLIEEGFDEKNLLRVKLSMGRYSNFEWVMSICPTLDCNFVCPYCYEGQEIKKPEVMGQEVIESVIAFLENKIPRIRALRIIWYGGEPLLEYEIMKTISRRLIDICYQNKCTYFASIITNGYILTPSIIKELKQLKIGTVQITIDPPKEYHNRRRVLRNGDATYDRVLANAYAVADEGIELRLRLNYDKENVKATFDFLKEPIFAKKNALPSLGRIAPISTHCADISDQCLTPWEHHEWAYKFNKKCRELGIGTAPYPPVTLGYCMSDGLSGFAIDPKGNVYKCLELIGEKSEIVGVIENGKIQTNRNLLRWQLRDPFDDPTCIDCDILPTCKGGCPSRRLRGLPLIELCSGWKHAFIDKLKDYYSLTSSHTSRKEVKT